MLSQLLRKSFQCTMQATDRIAEFFHGKTVLLTGGTGFIGKVLLEKLLRCFELKNVYILCRSKRDESLEERKNKLFESSVFNRIKAKTNFDMSKQKVVFIECNFNRENLNLKHEDLQLLYGEVNIVYHCAASMRFDETLFDTLMANVFATNELMKICKKMHRLQVLCHVSTAYCLLSSPNVQEKLYKAVVDVEKLLKILHLINFEEEENCLSKEEFNVLNHKILGHFPNTYSFSKAVAETLISSQFQNLPSVIVRPSVVLPALKEPEAGWTDTMNGPLGFQIAGAKGVLRTLCCDPSTFADMIPVDTVVNGLLFAVFSHHRTQGSQRVFNLINSTAAIISIGKMLALGNKVVESPVPFNDPIWYPGGRIFRWRPLHELVFLFQHLVPASIADVSLKLIGIKRALGFVQTYRRIYKGFEILYFYCANQFRFHNEQTMASWNSLLNQFEKEKYPLVGFTDDNCYEYYLNSALCIRKYILKESESSLPAARQHMKRMYWIDKLCDFALNALLLLVFCLFFLWFFRKN